MYFFYALATVSDWLTPNLGPKTVFTIEQHTYLLCFQMLTQTRLMYTVKTNIVFPACVANRGCSTNASVADSNRESQRAEFLIECSPPTMCHMSGVIGHVSYVRCQVSHVRCHVSDFCACFLCFLDKVVGLVDGGSVINGVYPVQFSR